MPADVGSRLRALAVVACLSCLVVTAGPAAAQSPQDFVDRGEAAFAEGRLEDAVAAFDRLTALDPEAGPWLWQRGIVLYYLGRYEACADQFAAYKQVNPRDLESAVWHLACRARLVSSIDEARASLLPPGGDQRVMRPEVYEMFAGRLSPAAVIGRAGFIGDVALFYAHFYAGLYAEVQGDRETAADHLRMAASDRFAEFGGFMNVVARYHRAQLEQASDRVGPPGTVDDRVRRMR